MIVEWNIFFTFVTQFLILAFVLFVVLELFFDMKKRHGRKKDHGDQ